MITRIRIECSVLVLVLAVAVWAFVETADMSAGSRMFPRMMILALGFFTLLALLRLWAFRGVEIHKVAFSLIPALRVLGFVGVTAAFVMAFEPLGFEIAGGGLILLGMLLLDWRVAHRYWWIAVILAPLLGVIFRMGLQLRLPASLPLF